MTVRPFAPTISAAASAAGTIGALGWIEPLAWVSSKSSEWPRLPLNSAAAGGEYAAPSPMTLAFPEPSPRWRNAADIEALNPASLRPRMEMPTWSRSSIRVRSTTSGSSDAYSMPAANSASRRVIPVMTGSSWGVTGC